MSEEPGAAERARAAFADAFGGEPEGGWAAVLRISLPVADEDLVLDLLERTGVLVHPGYYFDFTTEDFLVLSLLPEPGRFAAGAGAPVAASRWS